MKWNFNINVEIYTHISGNVQYIGHIKRVSSDIIQQHLDL